MAVHNLYGVDITKEVTPLMARDALIECFVQAHGSVLGDLSAGGSDTIDDKVKREAIELLIVKAFNDSEGDFEKPTKESLINAVEYLKKFSSHFRDPEVIEKHAGEVMSIINKIE